MNDDTELASSKRISVFWVILCLIGAIGTYAAILIPAYNGNDSQTQSLMSAFFWSGVLFAVIWKYRRKNGWIGFFLGLTFGLVMIFGNGFLHGYRSASKLDRDLSRLNTADTEQVSKFMGSAKDAYASKLAKMIQRDDIKGAKLLAATMFLGTYYRIGTVTPEYCANLGVDIKAFKSAYEEIHKNEYQTAVTLLSSDGKTIGEFNNNVSRGGYVEKFVKAELKGIRAVLVQQPGWESASLADVCELYNSATQEEGAMSEFRFSKTAPDAYEVMIAR